MNCERCQVELEDFLYGELSAPRAAAVKAHLAACPACSLARDGLQREAEVFARYYEQAALEPSAELWERIRARLRDRALARRQGESWATRLREWFLFSPLGSWLGSAALRQVAYAALLVVVSVAATALYFSWREDHGTSPVARLEPPTPQPGPSITPSPAPRQLPSSDRPSSSPEELAKRQPKAGPPAPKEPKPAPRRLSEDELIGQQVARAEREYQSAIQLLERRIARRKDSLDPVLVAQYESSLALINDSIAASRRALREHPKDPIAAQFLLAAYIKKLELMQEIAMR
jgi:hypothetical protein